jgi:hypothetical protein
MIGDLVQLPGPETGARTIVMTGKQKAPSGLHINRASREESAACCYLETTFEFMPKPHADTSRSQYEHCFAWLDALPHELLQRLKPHGFGPRVRLYLLYYEAPAAIAHMSNYAMRECYQHQVARLSNAMWSHESPSLAYFGYIRGAQIRFRWQSWCPGRRRWIAGDEWCHWAYLHSKLREVFDELHTVLVHPQR